jgi:UDP-N-acetylglucosamine 3-dehydrogenase
VIKPIRWGIIGAGRFGRVHARALASIAGVELVAISRRDPLKLAEVAAEIGVKRAYGDFRQLLADPEIDTVTICTHWQEHYDIALAALQSGKHVLLEKPMAATTEQCEALLSAAKTAQGRFMIGHVCRFDPRVTMAKQAIDDGRIGRIVSMHAKRNLPIAAGSIRLDKISPLMGDGIHDADLMMWFIGRAPSRVYGRNLRVESFQHPDVGWAMLEFGEQAIGVIETNWRLPANTPTQIDSRLEIAGTKGQLTIDCANTGLAILDENGLKQPDTAFWPTQHGLVVGALIHELNYFASCIRANKAPVVITPAEAARAVCVMEAAEHSAATGQPVEVRQSEPLIDINEH